MKRPPKITYLFIEGIKWPHFWTQYSPKLGLQRGTKILPSGQFLAPKIENGQKWGKKILEGKLKTASAGQSEAALEEGKMWFQKWKCSRKNVPKNVTKSVVRPPLCDKCHVPLPMWQKSHFCMKMVKDDNVSEIQVGTLSPAIRVPWERDWPEERGVVSGVGKGFRRGVT